MLKNKEKRDKIGKLFCFFMIAILSFCLLGCKRAEYKNISEAIKDDAVIGENVFIDDIDVSGLSVIEAQNLLATKHKAELSEMKIKVNGSETSIEVGGGVLPITFNDDEVLLSALNVSEYCPRNNEKREFNTKKIIDGKKTEQVIEQLVAPMNKKAENASVKYDSEAKEKFIYTKECHGECIDCKDATSKILECIENGEREINTVSNEIKAEYTLADAKKDNTLIAEFTTSFSGKTYSKPNRTFNIIKASEKIDGVRLEVGEEFDMNKILGDRNGKNGWKQAAGIRDGKYVQEYGGGVCQVSTTLYNAVLLADFEVTERHHHSWPLGYIDIGRDATISTGGPNFKFKNNSSVPITMASEVDEEKKTVSVYIFGRKNTQFSKITLTSEKVGTLEALGNEIIVDDSLPVGTKQVEREGRVGVVSECYKEYWNESGNIIKRELVTRDKYRSIQGIIRVSKDFGGGAVQTSGNNISQADNDWTEYFNGLQE